MALGRPAMTESAPPPGPAPGGLASPTLLGLYMLLLAIFILLVSMSTRADHRARAVIDGVSAVFNPHLAAGAGGAAFRLPMAEMSPPSDVLAEIGRLASGIPWSRIEAAHGKRELRLGMPLSSLFAPAAATLLPQSSSLLADIAAILARPSRSRHDLEILVGGEPAAERPLAQARALALARALVELGAPAVGLAVGLIPGPAAGAVFAFRVRAADQLDFRARGPRG
ncbi:MAG: hypothetical protein ACT4P2_13210 [Pseudomonadota bacterium]